MRGMTATTDRLPFTGEGEADRLLIAEPLAAPDLEWQYKARFGTVER